MFVVLDTFHDFAHVSGYLKFKHSAWRKGCTVSFEVTMRPTSSTPFWRAFTEFYQAK